jgi:prophage regulatory protein
MPFLRLPKVKRLTELSRSSIDLQIKTGHFPPPARLGGRAVGWVEEEILTWSRDCVLESRSSLRNVLAEPAA